MTTHRATNGWSVRAWALRGLRAWDRAPAGARLPAVIAWMVSIWLMSARHGGSAPQALAFSVFWNTGHFVVFGLLALLWRALLAGRRIDSRASDLAAVAVTCAYGLVDEWHQAGVPGRSSDLWDVGSDSFGAVFAISVAILLRSPLSERACRGAWAAAAVAAAGGAACIAMASR